MSWAFDQATATRSARSKIAPLPRGVRLLPGAVVDLLEHPRHGQQERRLERAEVGQQVGQVRGVPEADAVLHAADLDDPREHVRQRQEQQGARVVVPHARDERGRQVADEQQVAVGELAALRPPGRARRVDDRGQRVGPERRAAVGQLLLCDVRAPRGEVVEIAGLDLPDVPQIGQPVAHGVHELLVLRRLDHDGDRAGVGEDPLGLLRRGGLVDRDPHAAGRPDRVVGEGPLVAGLAEDADAVTGLDAGGDEAPGHPGDLRGELLARDRRPRPARLAAEDHGIGPGEGVGGDGIGERCSRRHVDGRGAGELVHGGSCRGLRM